MFVWERTHCIGCVQGELTGLTGDNHDVMITYVYRVKPNIDVTAVTGESDKLAQTLSLISR